MFCCSLEKWKEFLFTTRMQGEISLCHYNYYFNWPLFTIASIFTRQYRQMFPKTAQLPISTLIHI